MKRMRNVLQHMWPSRRQTQSKSRGLAARAPAHVWHACQKCAIISYRLLMQSFQQSNAAQALYAKLQCSALALSECILPRLVRVPVNKIEAANLAYPCGWQPLFDCGHARRHRAQQKVDLRDPLALCGPPATAENDTKHTHQNSKATVLV